jgi:broad specificity phosphatase PhoE
VSPLKRAFQTFSEIIKEKKDNFKVIIEPYIQEIVRASCDIGDNNYH